MKRSIGYYLAAGVLALSAQAGFAQGIEGIFQTQANDDGNVGMVQFAPCGGGWCGKLIKSFDAQGNELQTDKIGVTMVNGMTDQGGGKFSGGTILDPGNGKNYRSEMQLSGDSLKVKGCVAVFCKTQSWVRVR